MPRTRLRTLPPETPVMLALYYPLMDQLDWWSYRFTVVRRARSCACQQQARTDVPVPVGSIDKVA